MEFTARWQFDTVAAKEVQTTVEGFRQLKGNISGALTRIRLEVWPGVYRLTTVQAAHDNNEYELGVELGAFECSIPASIEESSMDLIPEALQEYLDRTSPLLDWAEDGECVPELAVRLSWFWAFSQLPDRLRTAGLEVAAGTEPIFLLSDTDRLPAAAGYDAYLLRLQAAIQALELTPAATADLLAVCFDDEGLRRAVLAG